MRSRINKIWMVIVVAGTIVSGCTKWEDHNAVTDAALTKDLFQQISENTALSKFAELLTKSGYDKVIASSKTFTVFAPTNTALTGLDPAIVNDTAMPVTADDGINVMRILEAVMKSNEEKKVINL